MDGGQKIGQGSYGCVYDPHLLCKGETVRQKNKVSKLVQAKMAHGEILETRIIDGIDKNFKWHLKVNDACDLELPDIEHDDALDGCKQSRNDVEWIREEIHARSLSAKKNRRGAKKTMSRGILKNLKNIVMSHGGDNISDYISAKPQQLKTDEARHAHFIDLFISVENLLQGVKEMYDNGICHFDIKAANVVYNESINRFNFIDFGLTQKIDKIQTFRSLSRAYFVWPLDLWLCYPDNYRMYFNKPVTLSNFNILNRELTAKYADSHALTIVNTCIDDGNPYTNCINTLQKFSDYKTYHANYRKKHFIRRISESIDTFSLGILFMQMMVAFTNTRFNIGECKLNPTIKHYNKLKSIHDFINLMISANSLNRIRPAKLFEYYISVTKPILTGVTDIGKKINHDLFKSALSSAPDMERSIQGKSSHKGKSSHNGKSSHKGKTHKRKKNKCPYGKILNPKTRRCINRTLAKLAI